MNSRSQPIKVTIRRQNIDPVPDLLEAYKAVTRTIGQDQAFVLESCGGGETDCRDSYLGIGKILSITATNDIVRVDAPPRLRARMYRLFEDTTATQFVRADRESNGYVVNRPEDMWRVLRAFQECFAISGDSAASVGYLTHIGYEASRYTENIYREPREPAIPDISLSLFQTVLTRNSAGECTLTQLVSDEWPQAASLDEAGNAGSSAPLDRDSSPTSGSDEMTETEYLSRVDTCLRHILDGDIYQVQIGHKVSFASDSDPIEVYRELRKSNPSPYMYLTFLAGRAVIGASPELFVRVEDDTAMMRPIAGTAARSADAAEDILRGKRLQEDPKEIAEHVMLIDLCRNDLGKVCAPGTVGVPSLMAVDRYSHVMHLVSTVSGELDDFADAWDVVPATFPAGTMTGAPKLRAMEIISEQEVSSRELYAGAVGLMGLSGDYANLALCIRTVIEENDGRYAIRASAGVVADSVPDKEWSETIAKMSAGVRVLASGRTA